MKMTNAADERALEYLRQQLKSGVWQQGARMPLLRDLARAAHVSAKAMSHALAGMRDRGKVISCRRGGIFIAPSIAVPPPRPREYRWDRVRRAMEQDVYAGTFATAGHVSIVSLQERYGAGYRIVKQAVDELQRQEILVQKKRGLAPAIAVTKSGSHAKIVFVSAGILINHMYVHGDRLRETLKTLQSACRAQEISLDVCSITSAERNRRGFFELLRSTIREKKPTGVIMWASGLSSAAAQEALHLFAAMKLPAAVLDDTGHLLDGVEAQLPPMTKVFTIAGTRAGQDVCRRLLSQGHRTIAYVSLYHQEQWSVDRLIGMELALRQSGLQGSIKRFVNAGFHRQDTESESLARTAGKNAGSRTLLDGLGTAPLSMNAEALHQLFELDHTTNGFNFLVRQSPFLKKALQEIRSDTSITAVVTCNDTIALIVAGYCRENRIVIPGRFSLASFDDTPISFEYGLASYDFNFPEIAHRMLSAVMRPRAFSRIYPQARVECPGTLALRGSIAPVKISAEAAPSTAPQQ